MFMALDVEMLLFTTAESCSTGLIAVQTCYPGAIHAVQQLYPKPAFNTMMTLQLGACCFTVKLALGDVEWGRRDNDTSKQ